MASIKKLQNHGVLRPRRGLAVSWAPCVSDQVISLKSFDGNNLERAPGPGLKPQDNNASFEGISEAEYNKRHMKALKDADPGFKLQATKASSLKPSVKRLAKRLA